ncbi:hypothetical protein HDU78_008181 [Chytriomyces hyalinus]|nr:hypothetical protein HDU78_008181 [Chytriomyces hyalinus]
MTSCAASAPALQAALQSCGFVFDAAGNSQAPVGMSPTALAACVCSNANLLIFQSTLASCVNDPAAVSGLNGLIEGCAAATGAGAGTGTGTGTGTGAGTGAGTGTGVGTGTGTGASTPCELTLTRGVQSLTSCGVTIDASGTLVQTASDAQTIACVCTATNVAVFNNAQTTCMAEVSAVSKQGLAVANALLSACAGTGVGTGAGTGSGTGAGTGVGVGVGTGAGAGTGTGVSTSAGAGIGSGSTGGSAGVVTTVNTAAAPAKSSGADAMFGLVGLFAAGALLI